MALSALSALSSSIFVSCRGPALAFHQVDSTAPGRFRPCIITVPRPRKPPPHIADRGIQVTVRLSIHLPSMY
ncbi:hypothetical protein IAQ61_000625 [Plenodomus lingam]|uniref:uncharacterized protein n=1 Tax=Leptosphaeria maculans TaxID=5022 RepID=UPI0033266957|nr:hypothetical protein IAQ61_000625 [Plenodomus lingam]